MCKAWCSEKCTCQIKVTRAGMSGWYDFFDLVMILINLSTLDRVLLRCGITRLDFGSYCQFRLQCCMPQQLFYLYSFVLLGLTWVRSNRHTWVQFNTEFIWSWYKVFTKFWQELKRIIGKRRYIHFRHFSAHTGMTKILEAFTL